MAFLDVHTSVCVLLCALCFKSECATFNDVKTEYTKLVDGYSIAGTSDGDPYSQTIPTNNLPIEVTLTLFMYSMAGFDPVAGTIDIVGSLQMEWIDELAAASSPPITFNSGTVSSFLVEYSLIWTPVIVLVNSANSIERVGDPSYKARYETATGKVTWDPRMILKVTCTPDVTYFPFDEQECTLTFQSWFHDSSLVQLQVDSDTWDTADYEENGIWSIESTSSRVITKSNYYIAEFGIKIKRNALYFTINIVFPILLLAALSGLLFLLPAGSGARVGFGIGCFLSFVVLLQVTMAFLPEASAPMSILCYYVILMMSLSAVLSIVNVLLLKIHMADEDSPLPKSLVTFVEIIKCIKVKRWWRKRKARKQCDIESVVSIEERSRSNTQLTIQNTGLINKAGEELDAEAERQLSNVVKRERGVKKNIGKTAAKNEPSDKTEKRVSETVAAGSALPKEKVVEALADNVSVGGSSYDDEEVIDWRSIASFLDFFFTLVFIGVQAGLSVVFLIPLASRAT